MAKLLSSKKRIATAVIAIAVLLTVILVPTLVLTLRAKAHSNNGPSYGSREGLSYPPTPEGVTVRHSKHHPNVTVSFKENKICETTQGVKSIAGYVHLPPGTLGDFGTRQDYPINSFFWFFESRDKPNEAPVSVWMNGGPGSSSLIAALTENGPCWINHDSASSRLNQWSWNNHVNMLYFDQPNQVGFSYDTLTPGVLSFGDGGDAAQLPYTPPHFVQNATNYAGVFSSNNVNSTANTTAIAAQAFWHFAQVFFDEFPQYRPLDDKVSIWTESYGGKYGPWFAAEIEETTDKINDGKFNYTDAIPLRIGNLGIVNGCVDDDLAMESYARIVYNNTYGLKFVSEEWYDNVMTNITKKGGIRDSIRECAKAVAKTDSGNEGDDRGVNEICMQALNLENDDIWGYDLPDDIYQPNVYDFRNEDWDPLPENYMQGFLNNVDVQRDLGVPVNFSSSSNAVYDAFSVTGDETRPNTTNKISYLLDRGVRVTMLYGDADIICNWFGGETVSLSIPYSHISDFRSSGYTDLIVNDSYVGGQTRQYGNFSFTRVYDAGHMVPWYQPETASAIFNRAMSGRDIATGKVDLSGGAVYRTNGTERCDGIMNKVPKKHERECYILVGGSLCTEEQWEGVMNGSAVIKDYIVQN